MPSYAIFGRLFRQLPVRDAARVAAAEVAGRLFDNPRTHSYTPYGEDLIAGHIIGQRSNGRYVDVGCNHPINWSNTYRLYLRGWTGLVIDANPAFEGVFKARRPRDQFVTACVSDTAADATLRIYQDPLYTSITAQNAGLNPGYAIKSIQTVRTQTLNDILAAQHFAPEFDLLSIDVEFHDQEVLRSIDLDHYKPKLIIVEAHDADPDNLYSHPIYLHARKNGYSLRAFHAANFFFARAA